MTTKDDAKKAEDHLVSALEKKDDAKLAQALAEVDAVPSAATHKAKTVAVLVPTAPPLSDFERNVMERELALADERAKRAKERQQALDDARALGLNPPHETKV